MVENKDSLLLALDQVAELAARGAASNSLVVGALRQAHEALSTLPIAGEGKVMDLDWSDEGGEYIAQSAIGWFHICRPASYWNLTTPHGSFGSHETLKAAKSAAQAVYETSILSALISSPGKDGGQEVEAVAISVEGSPLLEWAVDQWKRQVGGRPLRNVHRRSLDDVWRQVIRWAGGDPDKLVGPPHDELLAMESKR